MKDVFLLAVSLYLPETGLSLYTAINK